MPICTVWPSPTITELRDRAVGEGVRRTSAAPQDRDSDATFTGGVLSLSPP